VFLAVFLCSRAARGRFQILQINHQKILILQQSFLLNLHLHLSLPLRRQNVFSMFYFSHCAIGVVYIGPTVLLQRDNSFVTYPWFLNRQEANQCLGRAGIFSL